MKLFKGINHSSNFLNPVKQMRKNFSFCGSEQLFCIQENPEIDSNEFTAERKKTLTETWTDVFCLENTKNFEKTRKDRLVPVAGFIKWFECIYVDHAI